MKNTSKKINVKIALLALYSVYAFTEATTSIRILEFSEIGQHCKFGIYVVSCVLEDESLQNQPSQNHMNPNDEENELHSVKRSLLRLPGDDSARTVINGMWN